MVCDRCFPLWLAGLIVLIGSRGLAQQAEARSLYEQANALAKQGRGPEAISLYLRSLELSERAFGPNSDSTATVLNNLGIALVESGQSDRAVTYLLRSLKIKEGLAAPSRQEMAFTLANLGDAYADLADPQKAEGFYRRSLQVWETHFGAGHIEAIKMQGRLGSIYIRLGQYAKAEPLLSQSLKAIEAKLGTEHVTYAIALFNLAAYHRLLREYAKAEPLLLRSSQIIEKQLGKDHPYLANALNDLALVYQWSGDYEKAAVLYPRIVQIREARFGKDALVVGLSMNNWGRLRWFMNQDEQAEPLLLRGLAIRQARLPADHPDVVQSVTNLGSFYASVQRWDEALRLEDQGLRTIRGYLDRLLPTMAEAEQLAYLRVSFEGYLHPALSMARERAGVGRNDELSAGWVLNTKAVSNLVLAERALLARETGNPAMDKLIAQHQDVRGRLAGLLRRVPPLGQEATHRKELDELTREEQELASRVAQGMGRPAGGKSWVELGDVRRSLPANAVLIEIVRARSRNFQVRAIELSAKAWQGARYLAWVIPPADGGDVRLIDLGDAAALDAAVAKLRQALLQSPATVRQQGEAEAERALTVELSAVGRLALEPLRKHINDSADWLISPDADTWLIPWAALPLADGKYVIEKHAIRYLASGRELVNPASSPTAGRARIIADPDFDLTPDAARAELNQLVNKSKTAGELRGLPPSLQMPKVARLPGTRAEAEAIKPRLDQYIGQETWLYQDRQALEGVVKRIRNPKVLVLSTHGYFLPDQEAEEAERSFTERRQVLTKEGKALENPLLRCGLLLAGCNRPPTQAGDEDGVLTGLEIVGIDLRGTELVVLSACETGVGQVRNGEGVAGLRQAFQLAGARSVLATLWQIPDLETARLMSDFFGQLADKKGKAEALREAQLTMIKARRERSGAAHPFFWAAFTLTGQ